MKFSVKTLLYVKFFLFWDNEMNKMNKMNEMSEMNQITKSMK